MKACVIRGAGALALEDWSERPLAAKEVRLQFAYGGICGSDLHYVHSGRVANSIVVDPMILGHEFCGTVIECGEAAGSLKADDRVVVNPSRPCGNCKQCRAGLSHLCTSMRYMGSAAFRPHENGGFAERPVVLASQCHVVPDGVDLALSSLAEPYAVALHALARAGIAPGDPVLVTGAGTIGTLVAIAARQAGAGRIIVTDIAQPALDRVAALCGAETVNVGDREEADRLAAQAAEISCVIEASGAPQALDLAIRCAAPRGTIVQVGFLAPQVPLSLAGLLIKELTLKGAYRFNEEFEEAIRQIGAGEIDLAPLVTARFAMDDLHAAFKAANDRTNNLKVLLSFGEH